MLAADRAKQIKTSAIINESPTDKLIRELREENQRLMELLKQGGGAAAAAQIGQTASAGEPDGECTFITETVWIRQQVYMETSGAVGATKTCQFHVGQRSHGYRRHCSSDSPINSFLTAAGKYRLNSMASLVTILVHSSAMSKLQKELCPSLRQLSG